MPPEIPSPAREVRGTNCHTQPGEYAVYHLLAKSLVRCTPDGEMLNRTNEIAYVFDNLAHAQAYCHWKVNESPTLGCTVYDGVGRIVDQIFSKQHHEKALRAKDPLRQLMIGIMFLIVGSLLIWLDAAHGWMLIVGFLIGARLAIGGIIKISLVLSTSPRALFRNRLRQS